MPPMNAPTTAAAPVEQPVDPAFEKGLTQTMQGLSQLYMACHKQDPDSPLCDAIMSLQKAVAEVGRSGGSVDDPSMMGGEEDPMAAMGGEEGMPAEAGMEDPMAAMGGGEEMMPMPEEEPPPASIADAAGQTHNMMMEDAAKRRLAAG